MRTVCHRICCSLSFERIARVSLVRQGLRKFYCVGETASKPQAQSVEFAVDCLAVVRLLPSLAMVIEKDLWWSIVDALWEIANRTDGWEIDAEMPAEHCLVHQLLAGELPLALAYSFPEMRPLLKLRKSALDSLNEGLVELTNGEGLPRASHLEQFRVAGMLDTLPSHGG